MSTPRICLEFLLEGICQRLINRLIQVRKTQKYNLYLAKIITIGFRGYFNIKNLLNKNSKQRLLTLAPPSFLISLMTCNISVRKLHLTLPGHPGKKLYLPFGFLVILPLERMNAPVQPFQANLFLKYQLYFHQTIMTLPKLATSVSQRLPLQYLIMRSLTFTGRISLEHSCIICQ